MRQLIAEQHLVPSPIAQGLLLVLNQRAGARGASVAAKVPHTLHQPRALGLAVRGEQAAASMEQHEDAGKQKQRPLLASFCGSDNGRDELSHP